MSARRVTPKASTLPAKNGGSRLDQVLSVGMSNLSINKPTVVPEKATKFSFANAHKAPILSVSMAVLRKTTGVVPKSDIGVNWATWSPGQEDATVRAWSVKIAQALSIYPDNGKRGQIHALANAVIALGNPGGIAGPGSVNRGYYVYLLQVLEQALRSAQVQGHNDGQFAKDWAVIIKKVDQDTANLLFNALGDPTISNDVKSNIFAYFDYVNQNIYNYFTQGNIMADSTLAAKTSPRLTAYISSLVNPEVRELGDILRGMSSGRNRESPM
jgi:hypothetical protein